MSNERNHVYIVNVIIPKYKSKKRMVRVKKWVRETYHNYLDSNSTIYTPTQINLLIKTKYKSCRNKTKYSFAIDVSEEEAFNAMSASSIESKLDEIKPLNYKLPPQSYRFIAKNPENFKCSICLEETKDKLVFLRRCKCIFHRECIKKAHLYDKRCPLCSKKMCRVSKEPIECTI